MSKTRKEIECWARLKVGGIHGWDVLNFLVEEGVIHKDSVASFRQDPDMHKSIQKLLAQLAGDNKLQLLEYEWTILPVERIKITIVTDKSTKEFTHDF